MESGDEEHEAETTQAKTSARENVSLTTVLFAVLVLVAGTVIGVHDEFFATPADKIGCEPIKLAGVVAMAIAVCTCFGRKARSKR